MAEGVLDRPTIIGLLDEVARRLEGADHPPVELVVVGGAFMALQGLRASTADIDTISRLDGELRSVVKAVAVQRGLRPDWLNDRAAGFAPVGLTTSACGTLLERPRLVALGPPADFMFLMKLQAARAVDYNDMTTLWPKCSFPSPQAAAEAFAVAYPYEEHDPHLIDFIGGIARAASRSGRRHDPDPDAG